MMFATFFFLLFQFGAALYFPWQTGQASSDYSKFFLASQNKNLTLLLVLYEFTVHLHIRTYIINFITVYESDYFFKLTLTSVLMDSIMLETLQCVEIENFFWKSIFFTNTYHLLLLLVTNCFIKNILKLKKYPRTLSISQF